MKNSSLQDINSTVPTGKHKTGWKRILAFIGPAYLVSVGYMDPGNWATDIAGGSHFGYALIWVLIMSNLIALLLQSLSARLGIVAGLDLAQASRMHYPRTVNVFLWFLAEIAIAATDLAEVIGMAIGLQLLTGLPLLAGVAITVLDTFLLLWLQKFGIRKMEAFIIMLISVIGLSFLAELIFADPEMRAIAEGIIPSIPNSDALYIAIGIIGATVMPHNLYLHSSLVQTRQIERTEKGIRDAIRFNTIDSAIALNLALFVNAAILILAAASFYNHDLKQVDSIQNAHALLGDVLGTSVAPVLFAIALIAAGQSSTLTGTLSGQIVMEGYLNIRLQPWVRRIITRLIAIIPAVLVILIAGESKTEALLILSQVILSLQLGFAVIPLIHFVSDKTLMGKFRAGPWLIIPAWVCAVIIVSLNVKLVINSLSEWLESTEHPLVVMFVVIPLCILCASTLIYVTFAPFFKSLRNRKTRMHAHPEELNIQPGERYGKIAVCVDFSHSDSIALSKAIQQGGKSATYVLIHITETAMAHVMEDETEDMETEHDRKQLVAYSEQLKALGYTSTTQLGFGNPKTTIPSIAESQQCDLIVMGAHGHRGLKDIFFGATINSVRHNTTIPILVVRNTQE
ncbi:MAG: Nramp family divalent metal transporter [Bacteroidia bacterium]|nr:Nramp family divalent metal transporter [Bacteroidia bacterium]